MGLLFALRNILIVYGVFVVVLAALRYTILLCIRTVATEPPVAISGEIWVKRIAFMLLMIATLVCVWASMSMATGH